MTGATATPPRPRSAHTDPDLEDTSTLDSPSLAHAHSTPRAPQSAGKEPTFAEYPSAYESLRREIEGGSRTPGLEPTTPGKSQALPDMTMTPESSPFAPPTTSKKSVRVNQDPLLHRVLDKTYRIAATPHTARKQQQSVGFTPRTASKTKSAPDWADDSSPPSSPAPQLRADIFSSPIKGPRTPGVSVQQTPGKGKQTFDPTHTMGTFESDSDGDEGLDFSPPKTMQFHIPQSRLLQTPGKICRPSCKVSADKSYSS